MKRWATCALGLVFASVAVMHAQWLNYKTPGVPRTADGKAKLDAPTPRTLDGHPDLSGVWMHDLTPIPELRRLFGDFIDGEIKNELPGMEGRNYHKYGLNVLADFSDDTSPARPETKRIFSERVSNPPPEDLCDNTGLPFGFPGPGLVSEPIKLVQAPRVTMVIYEVGNNYRQIFTDGRTLPAEINLPSYFGYSVGRWDRDTLVIDTAGFNDKVPLDFLGHPRSEQLHITERFRRRDYGHLDTEITYNDSKFYTRPFTIRISYHLLADEDIFEMFSENEKDCAHIRGAQAK